MKHPKRPTSPERHIATVDPVLGRVIRKVGPPQIKLKRGAVHALAEIIVYQQLSGKVARAIFKRIRVAAGVKRLSAASLGRLTDKQLRAAGVSPQKLKYLRDLTAKVLDGSVKLHGLGHLSDEKVVAELTTIKGIGRWSAEMYLMFVLGRPDVFSAGDNGIQTAIHKLYGVTQEEVDLESFSERWRPHRTVACWYLWRSLATE
ncbi:MAG: DNA-3-methyladenine glycosylase 2 family protein [Candidatus Zixiibacteriota bacterium]